MFIAHSVGLSMTEWEIFLWAWHWVSCPKR